MDKLRKTFANPPASLRGRHFGRGTTSSSPPSSNARSDTKAHGMGGFFMYPRDGLETGTGPESGWSVSAVSCAWP